MLLVALLVPFVLLAACIAANPVFIRDSLVDVSVPITKHVSANNTLNAIQRDRARVANFASRFGASTLDIVPNVPLDDYGVVFVASIGVGEPPTYCESCQFLLAVSYIPILDQLIIDTGSANTWVGANQAYQVTKSSQKTTDSVVSIVSRADF
jgi:cathepsin E